MLRPPLLLPSWFSAGFSAGFVLPHPLCHWRLAEVPSPQAQGWVLQPTAGKMPSALEKWPSAEPPLTQGLAGSHPRCCLLLADGLALEQVRLQRCRSCRARRWQQAGAAAFGEPWTHSHAH